MSVSSPGHDDPGPEEQPHHDPEHDGGAQHGDSGGHHDHGDHARMFRDRFWVSLVLTVPVVGYADFVQDLFGYTAPTFPGSAWVAPALGTVVFAYGGWPFLSVGWSELKGRQPGMMLLVAMAITVAWLASVAHVTGVVELMDFWWELALLVTVMLLGHWLEMRALGQARGALAALAELLPDTAERVTDEGSEEVTVAELAEGDVVLVRPGGRVQVDAVGEDTTLAGIQRMVEQAQSSSTRTQALADRAAALLFYVALAAAAVTVVVWSGLGQGDAAVARTVTVLVIACPHALGLAIPLVTSISTSLSALALAAAVEADSEHPLARAIVAHAHKRGLDVPAAREFQAMAGRRVRAAHERRRGVDEPVHHHRRAQRAAPAPHRPPVQRRVATRRACRLAGPLLSPDATAVGRVALQGWLSPAHPS